MIVCACVVCHFCLFKKTHNVTVFSDINLSHTHTHTIKNIFQVAHRGGSRPLTDQLGDETINRMFGGTVGSYSKH